MGTEFWNSTAVCPRSLTQPRQSISLSARALSFCSLQYYDDGQALQAGTVRPPEGKPAASEGADGEVRASRSSLVRMRDVNPPEVPLRQAPYNPPQDVASNSGSLVQVAEQAHPLVQRCPSPNPMREHRNNRTHEEVVVGGGATPHG